VYIRETVSTLLLSLWAQELRRIGVQLGSEHSTVLHMPNQTGVPLHVNCFANIACIKWYNILGIIKFGSINDFQKVSCPHQTNVNLTFAKISIVSIWRFNNSGIRMYIENVGKVLSFSADRLIKSCEDFLYQNKQRKEGTGSSSYRWLVLCLKTNLQLQALFGWLSSNNLVTRCVQLMNSLPSCFYTF